jgi:hypothetical protein
MIKICPDPCCDAVFHNCDKKDTHCKCCDAIIVKITAETYKKKFAHNFFQYDYPSGDIYRPAP